MPPVKSKHSSSKGVPYKNKETLESFKKDSQVRKPIGIPNHNYLGPGNTAQIEGNPHHPVDSDDLIASEHDNAYHQAQTKEDVYKADREAINKFGVDAWHNKNWHSAVGAVGLGLKHGVERLTNRVFYPSLPGKMPVDHNVRLTLQEGTQKKPWWSYKYNKSKKNKNPIPGKRKEPEPVPSTSREGEQSNKRAREDSPISEITFDDSNVDDTMSGNNNNNDESNMDTDAGITTGAAGVSQQPVSGYSPGVGGPKPAAGVRGTVQFPPGHRIKKNVNIQTYTQQYKFRIRSSLMEYATTGVAPQTQTWRVRFPYHDLPVSVLGFYLQKEEILKIIDECTHAKILNCKVKVYAKQAQLPFVTGQTITGIANNNIGYYLNKIDPIFGKYRQGILDQYDFIEENCWGKHIAELPAAPDFTPANLGELGATHVTRNLDQRFVYVGVTNATSIGTDNTFNYLEQIPPIEKYIEKRWNASFNEGLFCEWEYQPRDGLFHQRGKISDKIIPYNNDSYYNKIRDPYTMFGKATNNTANWKNLSIAGAQAENSTGTLQNIAYVTEQMPLAANPVDYNIEWDGFEGVPPLILGLQPIVTGTIGTTQGDLVDCQLELEIHTEIQIEELRGTSYMMRFGGSLVQPDPAYGTFRPVVSVTQDGDVSYYQGTNNFCNRNGHITVRRPGLTTIAPLPQPDLANPQYTALKPKKINPITEDDELKQKEEEINKIKETSVKEYLLKQLNKAPKKKVGEVDQNKKRGDAVKRSLFKD